MKSRVTFTLTGKCVSTRITLHNLWFCSVCRPTQALVYKSVNYEYTLVPQEISLNTGIVVIQNTAVLFSNRRLQDFPGHQSTVFPPESFFKMSRGSNRILIPAWCQRDHWLSLGSATWVRFIASPMPFVSSALFSKPSHFACSAHREHRMD